MTMLVRLLDVVPREGNNPVPKDKIISQHEVDLTGQPPRILVRNDLHPNVYWGFAFTIHENNEVWHNYRAITGTDISGLPNTLGDGDAPADPVNV